MSLINKLKNALFEEVEETVEVRKEDKVEEKKDSFFDRLSKEKKETPIAKKVVLKEDKVDDIKVLDSDFDIPVNKNKVEIYDYDTEYEVKDDDLYVKKEEFYDDVRNDDYQEESYYDDFDNKKEDKAYSNTLYGQTKNDNNIKMHQYGSIAKTTEKISFKPSPIISPIYGILDKNYKKEDIVSKKESRVITSFDRERVSVDDIRDKAYGNETELKVEEVKEEEKLLVDLSKETDKPEVKKITVGDAEEYFEDLGLEYNVDYMDGTKTDNKEVIKENSKVEDINDEDDDNLFDLIDSMYKEKE